MARLHRVVLPVSHIDQAVALYAELLEMSGERVSPGVHYFNCGGPILALFDPIADGIGWPIEEKELPNQYLYIGVPELDWVYWRAQELGFKRLVALYRDPIYGERLCCLRDPFGNLISFVEESTLFSGDGVCRAAPG
ncbi:MAG TPA: VOC family protein [Gemmataceae bacterium]|nr:VOC family protein [Gemmataceae bacterium]